jgi:23S rRNA G2445 N2-methylase RlmL
MPVFLALTSRGLHEPLAAELEALKLKRVVKRSDAVQFEGPWTDLYRAHLYSRLCTRILQPVCEFQAFNQDDLYFGILRKHDFTKYIRPNQTLRVEAHVRENKNLTDQRFVAMKVKDALVDQFRAKFAERPSVGDEANADLRVVVRIIGSEVSVALDLTGESLSYRGYRQFMGEAPLREHLAAGLSRLAGWQSPQPLVDPFCGSGTILIEAALSARGYRAGRSFAFERLLNFQADVYRELVNERFEYAPTPQQPILFGYDKDGRVLETARSNARAAGVEKWIHFEKCDVAQLRSPEVAAPGMVLTNPPYGERLEDLASAKELMTVFAATLKREFKGWDAWILNGNAEVASGLKLKAKQKIPVMNAQIDCRLLHYPIT